MSLFDFPINPRRIPIIGDDIYQVGQVYDIISQPCTPDPILAVRAMFAYSPSLIWALAKPDLIDMTFDRAARRHKRKTRRKFLAREFIQIPLEDGGKPAWAFFRLGQAVQRVGWYLILADATTDWAVNWTSLAYEWSGCNTPNAAWGRTWGTSLFYIEPFVPMPHYMTVQHFDSGGTGTSSRINATLADTGPYTWTYTCTPQLIPYQGQIGTIEGVFVEIYENNQLVDVVSADPVKLQDGNTAYTAAGQRFDTVRKKVEVTPSISWTQGRCGFLESNLQLTGGPSEGLLPDP